jgi:PAS domain S-box-containing protein
MRLRPIAAAAFVLALTLAGFVVARVLAEREARDASSQRVKVAGAQIRSRLAEGTSLTESLQRFMVDEGGTGVTSARFARNALRWLSPADFPAAAWAERVRARERAAYERRIGQAIAAPGQPLRVEPRGSSYLPATLVSGFPPTDLRGMDLSREPGIEAALRRAIHPGGVGATPVAAERGGTSGLFLVAPAPNLIDGVLHPGAVAVFVSETSLLSAADKPAGLQLGDAGRAQKDTVRDEFTVAGRRFAAVMPTESVSGPGAALPWIILAAGLVLATLAWALGTVAARRARAQDELDRIFTLSPDLIAIADFEGRFKRVNPAVEQILGYTEEEFLARPYLQNVHPEDRERTVAEASAIGKGKTTRSFENRYLRKDGSWRVLQWTSAPVVEDGLMYGVARDVTERREADAEIERLADEQAALRRVATLVAKGVQPAELFSAVTQEVARLFLAVDRSLVPTIIRFDPGPEFLLVGTSKPMYKLPLGSRWGPKDLYVSTRVLRTGRTARVEETDVSSLGGSDAELLRRQGFLYQVGSPITVEGRLWGALTMNSAGPLPPDTGERLESFTELVATAIANAESRGALARLAEEQAALRRVAVLVAEDVPASELFGAVTREAGTLLAGDFAGMARFEGDAVVTVGVWAADGGHPPVPSRWEMQPGDPATTIADTREPARWDDWAGVPGPIARFIRELGIRSTVGTPIVVEGRLWGALALHSKQSVPLPPETESRMAQFTDLVATAIANRQARAELARLADEQAALRRVATLVARDTPQAEVFAAIATEIARLLGLEEIRMVRYEDDRIGVMVASSGAKADDLFPVGSRVLLEADTAASRVFRTGQPVRIDDYASASGTITEAVRSTGIRGVVGAPISVEGRLWGAMTAGTTQDEALPPDTEARLAQFTELMATAIANTESHARADRLADEQAALRRVATLVAKEAPPQEVFGKVAEELANVVGDVDCSVFRDEGDGTASLIAVWGTRLAAGVRVGTRMPVDGNGVIASVLREGRPCRIGDYSEVTGAVAERGRELGIRSAVGSPITVRGRIWGAMGAARYEAEALPPDTEARIARFADLVATAVANAEARAEVTRLADEQAALRRVATVVARGGSRRQVFNAIAEEVRQLIGADFIDMLRYEDDRGAISVASGGVAEEAFAVGSRHELGGDNATSRILRTGQPVRIDHYDRMATGPIAETARPTGIRSVVGAPLIVNDQLWGAVTIGTTGEEPLPQGTEARLGQFTELMSTAIANTESRAEVERLAQEQAALRRVATLVAEGAPPTAVFDAVAAETERLLGADRVSLSRYEPDAEITVLAHRGSGAEVVPTGSRLSHQGDNVQEIVRRTEQPARMENFDQAEGEIADVQRAMGVSGVVAVPVVVEGRVWGVIGASWVGEESPPVDTEGRMAKFAGLLETAIANADSRDQLDASRERLVTEADEARRRVVRDLHDGAQQRLVHAIVTMKLAQRAFRKDNGDAEPLVREALDQAEASNRELRELAHGLLPAVLTRGGLRAGVDAVVSRLDLPVHVDVPAKRLPEEIEASAYFIVAEALTNVVKHSDADRADVTASVEDGVLRVEVRDDGIGGADPDGHGLVGIADRVTALGGRLEIDSPLGDGTFVAATLPLPAS